MNCEDDHLICDTFFWHCMLQGGGGVHDAENIIWRMMHRQRKTQQKAPSESITAMEYIYIYMYDRDT
jgi:hypothetical protein